MNRIKDMVLSCARTCAFLALAIVPSALTAREISLDQGDNGKRVVLDIGDTMTVALGANPSTGFSWKIASLHMPNLAFQNHTYIPREPVMPGSPGISTFTFAATAPGSSELCLAYARPWMKDVPPISTFRVTVTVYAVNSKSR